LRHRELQETGLGLHVLRFVAVPPPDTLTGTAPIMLSTEKGRGLGFDRHLQHVPREATYESDHR
jgi:hypothetical protein